MIQVHVNVNAIKGRMLLVKKKSTRDIMRDSNEKAIQYMLNELNAQHVFLKPHYKFPTTTYMRDHAYKNQDIFNLFDGLCSWKRQIYGIQVKTDAWDVIKKHVAFQEEWANNLPILFINVNKETGEVKHREFLPKPLNIKTKSKK